MGVFEVVFGFLVLLSRGGLVSTSCYFQQEFQGEYEMQSSVAGFRVQYTILNINATSIPAWGNCHKRIGTNYILKMSHGETSCIRCLHLKLRSSNVLQVITSYNTFSKCHINEEQAIKRCPTEDSLKSENVTEILLFKTKDMHGEPSKREYCPLDEKYSVIYSSKDSRSGKKLECNGLDSTIDSCPSGSTLDVELKGCNFETKDFKFECLGSWKGSTDHNFIIFKDRRQQKPKYRCAVYERERKTGKILLALGNDSTCNTDLRNTSSSFETLILAPKQTLPWPPDVTLDACIFPDWMQGNWEHIRVNRDTLVYQDHSSFKTYTIKCAGFQEMESKFLVYTRTQCDEEHYACMWIQKRTNNVLEFQMGMNTSETNNVFDLCHEQNFIDGSWITQGRLAAPTVPKIYPGMCPIAGEYTGVIPDSPDLCAKLWSDCNAELMYYQVSSCETGEIYEEREYECLGHWNQGHLLYTYTQRLDVAAGTYECFVGSIKPTEEIFIKEAGSFCQRNIDPVKDGMQLIKKGLFSCVTKIPKSDPAYELTTESTTTKLTTSRPAVTVGLTKSTRKPWNFDNDIHDVPNPKSPNGANAAHNMFFIYVYSMSMVIFVLKCFQ